MRTRFTSLHRKGIFWVLVGSVLLRLASAFYQGDIITAMPGVHDQISYHALAERVVAGYGFSFASDWWPATRSGEPTAHWSFFYTLYVSVIYFIFGPHPLAARLIQALVAGLLHPWLVWRIGRHFFTERVATTAALLVAFYAYFVFYSGALMTETFYILAILWTFETAARLRQRTGASRPALSVPTYDDKKVTRDINWTLYTELGTAIGITVLLRQVFLLFVPVLFGWIIWQTRPQLAQLRPQLIAPQLRGLILSVAVVLILVIPWSIRNYLVFDSFVLLNTNAGFAYFWGNHPVHGNDFVPILPTSYGELIPEHLRELNEAELDRALLREGLGFVAADPVRYGILSLSRLKEYFKFWPSSSSSLFSNLARVGSFGLCLPFTLLGFWIGLRPSVREFRSQPGAVFLVVFVVFYTVTHLLTWSLIRYRLPIDSFLLTFAAIGMVAVYESIKAWQVPKGLIFGARS